MKISTVLPGAARWEFSSSWKENTKTSFASEREREREGEIAPLPVNDGNKNIRLILTETEKKSAPTLFLGHRSMSQIRLYVSLYNDKLTAIISPLTALK